MRTKNNSLELERPFGYHSRVAAVCVRLEPMEAVRLIEKGDNDGR
jgi:hypothetical protein